MLVFIKAPILIGAVIGKLEEAQSRGPLLEALSVSKDISKDELKQSIVYFVHTYMIFVHRYPMF